VAYTNATDPGSFPKGQTFDTVVCLNVVEHVDQDVTALRNIWESLDEGGRAIVLVPCGPELFGTLDEILGHVRRYTEAGLIEVATQAGFQVERLLKFNRAGVLGWWLNGRVLRKKTFDLGQIRMLNILTPLFRLLEPVLPLPPLSLIAILRKEASRPGFSESTTASAASSVKL
jgi:SAM-dependent methyltransferase